MSAVAMPEFPTMVPSMVSKKRIVSVCPLPRFKQMPIGNCIFPFQIPAQGRDQYHILEVADTYTMIRTGFSEETEAGIHLAPAPISARVLADSLVSEWNASLSNVGSLGLMVLPDHVQEGSMEFKQILQTLTAQVREVAEWAIRQANDWFGKHKSEYITNGFHRKLAVWLMGEEGARAIPWYNAQAINALKACIACGDSINATAKVCKSCGTDLVDYFIKYKIDPEQDPIVAAMATRVTVPVQTKGTTSQTGAPAGVRVNLGASKLPADARASCVNVMNGEEKAQMNLKRGQDDKDEYILSLIPDLCLKNAGLRESLKSKGYVVEE